MKLPFFGENAIGFCIWNDIPLYFIAHIAVASKYLFVL